MTLKNLVTVALFFAALSLLPACSGADEKKVKHYDKAMEYIKASDDKAAIIELKNAIQLDAKYAEARYQLGLLHLKNGDARGAFGELQRAATLDPKNLDAAVKVAEFHLLSRNKEESRKYVDQVLASNPQYQDALALLANLELIDGNFAKAGEAIDKALAASPDNDKFHNIKGRVLAAENKWDEAEAQFKKAIELKPDQFANYRTLLMLHEQRKNEAAVQQLLATMEEKFPDNTQLQLMLAGVHQKKGEFDKAEQTLQKAISLDKNAAGLRLSLVEFYKGRRQFDKAEETLKTAIVDLPKDLQLQSALGELQFDLQKFTEARAVMDGILAGNPGHGSANLLKSRFLLNEGKNDEAIQVITPLTNDYPKWPEPFYYSALAHLRIGKVELAQKAIEIALQNNPASDRYHLLAAQIHLVRGNGKDAEREAGMALGINPRNFMAVRLLTQAFVQTKAFDKAIKIIESLDEKILNQDAEFLGVAGMAYLGKNNPDMAKKHFTALLALAPDNAKALGMLTALTAGKDLDKAIDFVNKHIAAHPAGGHYLLLGDLYTNKRRYDDALQAYEKAQELRPEDPQGYILKANLLNMLGKSEETIAQFNELLAAQPDSIPGLMGLATAFEGAGRYGEAKTKYQRVLELQPNLPAAANNLAWLIASEENGDLGEALRLAMQAKQALPDQANITDTLGWVHYKRQSFPLAITQFRQALETRPEDPVIRYHLALALHANGEVAEAVTVLEKVLSEDTRFKEREEAQKTLNGWKK
jgi:tetratricopeptide (TPR) repeat protein